MACSHLALIGECPAGVRVRFLLSSVRLTVGRHGDIVLPEPSVSRKHAVLIWNGDAWKVSDAGSRNGTFVNGVGIQRKFVVPGDVIKFGRVALTLVDTSDETSVDDAETFVPTMLSGVNDRAASLHGEGVRTLVGHSEPLKCAMQIAVRAAKNSGSTA